MYAESVKIAELYRRSYRVDELKRAKKDRK